MSAARPVKAQGFVFDLDGTLIDYEGASHTALSRPLAARGKTYVLNPNPNPKHATKPRVIGVLSICSFLGS